MAEYTRNEGGGPPPGWYENLEERGRERLAELGLNDRQEQSGGASMASSAVAQPGSTAPRRAPRVTGVDATSKEANSQPPEPHIEAKAAAGDNDDTPRRPGMLRTVGGAVRKGFLRAMLPPMPEDLPPEPPVEPQRQIKKPAPAPPPRMQDSAPAPSEQPIEQRPYRDFYDERPSSRDIDRSSDAPGHAGSTATREVAERRETPPDVPRGEATQHRVIEHELGDVYTPYPKLYEDSLNVSVVGSERPDVRTKVFNNLLDSRVDASINRARRTDVQEHIVVVDLCRSNVKDDLVRKYSGNPNVGIETDDITSKTGIVSLNTAGQLTQAAAGALSAGTADPRGTAAHYGLILDSAAAVTARTVTAEGENGAEDGITATFAPSLRQLQAGTLAFALALKGDGKNSGDQQNVLGAGSADGSTIEGTGTGDSIVTVTVPTLAPAERDAIAGSWHRVVLDGTKAAALALNAGLHTASRPDGTDPEAFKLALDGTTDQRPSILHVYSPGRGAIQEHDAKIQANLAGATLINIIAAHEDDRVIERPTGVAVNGIDLMDYPMAQRLVNAAREHGVPLVASFTTLTPELATLLGKDVVLTELRPGEIPAAVSAMLPMMRTSLSSAGTSVSGSVSSNSGSSVGESWDQKSLDVRTPNPNNTSSGGSSGVAHSLQLGDNKTYTSAPSTVLDGVDAAQIIGDNVAALTRGHINGLHESSGALRTPNFPVSRGEIPAADNELLRIIEDCRNEAKTQIKDAKARASLLRSANPGAGIIRRGSSEPKIASRAQLEFDQRERWRIATGRYPNNRELSMLVRGLLEAR